MITLHLTPSDRRTLIGGVLAVGTLLAGAFVVPAWRGWARAQAQDATEQVLSLHRAERTVTRRASTRRDLARVATLLAPWDSATLSANSMAGAGTALADAVSEAAEASGAMLSTVQVRRDSLVQASVTHVSATVSLTGDIESLALFIETLEVGPPLLLVRQATITGGGASVTVPARETLRMEMLIEGVFQNLSPSAGR